MVIRKAVLINRTQSGAPSARVAGLSQATRAVLAAQDAGLEEILILGGEEPSRWLPRRARSRVRWLPLSAETEIGALRAAGENLREPFLLLFADSVAEAPALNYLRRNSLNGRLLVRTRPTAVQENAPASVFVASADLSARLDQADGSATIEELWARCPGPEKDVASPPEGRTWERTSDRVRLAQIERDLALGQLKLTDGIYARFNKTVIGWPLIRFFLRTPATPNFITGLGLLFAVFSGIVFSQGGYLWGLGGALLTYLSALMDHADGMVARLKFQQSDFGTWFESAVDYASYIFIYTGMAIGLYRETQVAHYLVVGALFGFGAIISSVVLTLQRKRISGDRPADYARRWHASMDANKHNFLHLFGRKCYFILRRAVAPFYIFLLCLLDLRGFLLGISTLSANLVWIISLYNNRLFARSPALKSS